MNRLGKFATVAWSTICIMLCFYVDFSDTSKSKSLYISDYLMTFHVAGRVIAEGKWGDLYPSEAATSFIDAPFDHDAHRILPGMPAQSLAEFMYPPLTAGLFVPLSFLKPEWSLAVWQVISLCALAGSVYFLIDGVRRARKDSESAPVAGIPSWGSLTFLPVFITIWIGQVGIVFGLFPLCLGYWLFMRGQPLVAGLAWSLAVLKPQFLVPAMVLIALQVFCGRLKPMWGLIAGLSGFAALNLLIFSPGLCSAWLRCLKLSDIVYSNLKFGVSSQLMLSLPRALILIFPPEQQAPIKIAGLTLAGIILLATFLVLLRLLKSQPDSTARQSAAFALAAVATPLVVPYLFMYDLSVWVVAGLIVANVDWAEPPGAQLRQATLFLWLTTTVYVTIVFAHKEFAPPLVFVGVMLILWLRALTGCLKWSQAGAPQSAPAS